MRGWKIKKAMKSPLEVTTFFLIGNEVTQGLVGLRMRTIIEQVLERQWDIHENWSFLKNLFLWYKILRLNLKKKKNQRLKLRVSIARPLGICEVCKSRLHPKLIVILTNFKIFIILKGLKFFLDKTTLCKNLKEFFLKINLKIKINSLKYAQQ